MAGHMQDLRTRSLEEVSAARRTAMLRLAIRQQEAKHYAEALDMYRQLIEEYPDTDEESEARERILDLAHLFGAEKQPYRMLSLYNTLESMYAPTSSERTTEARRTRVKEILGEVHQEKQREAEAEARIETIREGRLPPERAKPAREPRRGAIRRKEDRNVA
jgi:hypothetical protein